MNKLKKEFSVMPGDGHWTAAHIFFKSLEQVQFALSLDSETIRLHSKRERERERDRSVGSRRILKLNFKKNLKIYFNQNEFLIWIQ